MSLVVKIYFSSVLKPDSLTSIALSFLSEQAPPSLQCCDTCFSCNLVLMALKWSSRFRRLNSPVCERDSEYWQKWHQSRVMKISENRVGNNEAGDTIWSSGPYLALCQHLMKLLDEGGIGKNVIKIIWLIGILPPSCSTPECCCSDFTPK